MSIALPIRHSDGLPRPLMTRRGWWLVVLNFVLPGSAQVLAGNRRLGRVGLGMTLGLWGAALIVGIGYLIWPVAVLTAATNTIGLVAAQIILAAYAVLWVVLTVDTLRLVKLVRTAPSARAWIAALGVLLMVGTAGTAVYGVTVIGSTLGFLGSVFQNQAVVPPIDGRYNIMLLGSDAGPDRDGARPDSISVVSIDAETGRATMIGLPRNLEDVPFPADSPMHETYPDGYYDCDVDVCMLNSIYTEVQLKSPERYPNAESHGSAPGIEATRDAVEGALGIQVQYFVSIDMQGFSDLIDALGGVEITVDERLPIGGDEDFNNVDGWVEAGTQHMNGFTALWYARARHGTSDYDRMARQRVLQEAVLKQFNPANVVTKFQAVAKAGEDVVKTDIPQSMLGVFADLAMKTRALPIDRLELVPPAVDPEDPDFDVIHQMVAKALAPVTPTPKP